MLKNTTVKELHGFRYYTGLHPEIRRRYRAGKRPSEFGNKVWPTSLVLLDYLHARPFELKGLRALEIGCGWGLLGVYLAKEFGCDVTCTDLDPHVLPIVDMHAELNGVSVRTRRAAFDELTPTFLEGFDVVVGAEVCYSDEVAQALIRLMDRAFAAGVRQVILADPGRPGFTDFHAHCIQRYRAELFELPGTVNGKTTRVLSARAE